MNNRHLYSLYEAHRACMLPYRIASTSTLRFLQGPGSILQGNPLVRNVEALSTLFEQMTRHYSHPEFGIKSVEIGGKRVRINKRKVISRSFCHILHFEKEEEVSGEEKVLLVAPLSGHFATLLRDTVRSLLPHFDVYVTDWSDAKMISLREGKFDLNTYIDYLIDFIQYFEGDINIVAICQAALPVYATVGILSNLGVKFLPKNISLLAGPIDTRISPTQVNKFAKGHSIGWFKEKVIMNVPYPNPGAGRLVYPGFLQLSSFMAMNISNHVKAHEELYRAIVEGDTQTVDRRTTFYEEYRSVMDITADFYLDTIKEVFHEHSLASGRMQSRWRKVDLSSIGKVGIQCLEAENDDICGIGQTKAALDLATNLDNNMKSYALIKGIGHYGIFSGRKFRESIVPKIVDFIYKGRKVKG